MSELDNRYYDLSQLQDTLACQEHDADMAESDEERDSIMSDIDDLQCTIADCEEDIRYLEEEAENDGTT